MMRHFYKSHGKHCYLRSFQTKCPKCGTPVLYWECTHGCKIFFEYPPYGKLIKHICRQSIEKKRKNKYPIIIKKPRNLLEEASPSCPVCGKLFKNETNLKEHLKASRQNDYRHDLFLKGIILINDKRNQIKTQYKPKFGRINVKKRKNNNESINF
ncbi:MAG: hypothetical protein ACTSRI_16685 [Promethearchaeota archaeon]